MPAEWLGRPLAETRWMLEAARLLVDPVAYGRGVPRGDGRPVVVMPGFLASDDSLLLLRRWLRIVGYRPHTAGFLFNVDCADRAVERVERLVEAITPRRPPRRDRRPQPRRPPRPRHRRAPAGAGLARDLDGRRPPGPVRDQLADAGGGRDRATRRAPHPPQPRPGLLPRALRLRVHPRLHGQFPVDRVRLTSIYTKGDGVVRWERAIVEEADCVEVTGSHIGLMANRKAYRAIADALAQPELRA